MQPLMPLARDPAPSRWSYRIQRMWLTPLYRGLLRKGLPVFLLLFAIGWYVTDAERLEALQIWADDLRRSIEERPEFMVRLMKIEGASPELSGDIREIMPLDLPLSSFDLDLDHMRGEISGLDAVAGAELRVVSGGVLMVRVTERLPAVVWRSRRGLELLDAEGHRVAALERRGDAPELPLVAGEGAERAVPEALELIAAAAPISDRLRGLRRIGERRWDVVLDRDQRIMLPEHAPIAALERVIALDNSASDVLARDVTVVDMRDGRRPILRLTAEAMEELRRLRALDGKRGEDA
ncbi:cell division protein FtsQ [Maritimibacter sp. 55A14]|uniref:cell division protein FtsQ/DivIB n=1 Tax=Maritimibacter sp. 55A14 TaxID=2174844 RepID=UPI000D609109|nr:cell division protein FtsQ/DivIB [Maritimibacter sp. 55A14]PWE34053.1 cell division protein FtsQ [Maritimibacter sp. 55A14]